MPESLISFRKCVVSFTYNLLCVDRVLRKWSIDLDILSVGQPIADTIDLPACMGEV